MPTLSFSHPWYLLLLPVLIGGAVWLARRSLAGLRGWRASASLSARIAILALAVGALAGLQISLPARTLAVLFVVDQSDSVPTERKRQALEFVNAASLRMGDRDRAALVVFGGNAYLEKDFEKEVGRRLSVRQVHSIPSRDYSNVAASLRLALAAFPDNTQKRVVLISDGNENLGSAVEEAAGAASDDVEIDVVPVQYEYPSEALLEKLVLPSEAKVGEPFEVRVIARSTRETSGVIRLLRNGALIAQQRVRLLAGPNVITFNQSLEEARFHTYEALLEAADDSLPENNRGLGFVLVKGKPRVLIVEDKAADARFLTAALRGQKLEVDVREPGQLPATLAEFQSYDSVVLSNVGAFQLTPDQMKAIRSSVRDLGTGLVMIGGPNSFGPGAYRGTPIEEALPVDMEVRKSKVMPVGAVAMVLHTCEFPDGNRWARETAAAVVDVLGERDKVGVLQYGMGGEEWGIPMQLAANKEGIKAKLYNLDPGDMPDYHRMLELAYAGLTTDAKEAAVRHIIVISDGDASAPSGELMGRLRKAKITVTTVAVFPHGGGTGTLQDMARVGGGEFYNVRRPQDIPRIFLKEAQRVLKPAIIEEMFVPNRLKDSQLLTGIDRVPPLLGYVSVTPKEAATVEVALTSKRDDPVLASWRFGLGKAVAFMSDAKNRWAAPWLGGGDTFARFWAQTIRWTVRTTARANIDAQVEIGQQQGRVVVDVVNPRGDFVNGLDLRGSVAATNVSPELRMAQTAPGRYEGSFDAPEKGQYLIALRYQDADGTPRTQLVGASVAYSPEYRDLSANTAVLTTLAERTRGKILAPVGPTPHDSHLRSLWAHDRRAHTAPQELWAALLLTAALLLPVDIGIRRLMVSRSEWSAFMRLMAQATFGWLLPQRTSGAVREQAMGTLLGAKARAARQMGAEGDAPESAVAPLADVPQAAEAAQPTAPAVARTMPTVPGARSVTPPVTPASGTQADLPPLERLDPAVTDGAGAAGEAAAAAESMRVPQPAPTPPSTPAAPIPTPGVVGHRPVEGRVTEPDRTAAETVQGRPDAGSADGDTEADGDATSRLLRARRRARGSED